MWLASWGGAGGVVVGGRGSTRTRRVARKCNPFEVGPTAAQKNNAGETLKGENPNFFPVLRQSGTRQGWRVGRCKGWN